MIEFIKRCFCKHELKREENPYTIYDWDEDTGEEYMRKKDIKVSVTCLKCTYHKSYWKFAK